jgi:hypothetical protein
LTRHYTAFDRSLIDGIWNLSWGELLQRYNVRRKAVGDLLEWGLEPEPTRAQISDILDRRTLKWAIRRCRPQFFIMGELLALAPALKRHVISVRVACVVEPQMVVALAAARFRQGRLSRATLRAVCKLHSVPGAEGPRGARRLLTQSQLRHPLYQWQGSEACLYSSYGLTDDLGNCLKTSGTRGFLKFVEQCWTENCSVPDSTTYRLERCSHLTPADRSFRRLEIANAFRRVTRVVSRFRRPAMWYETT